MTVTSDDAEQSVGSPSGDTAPVAQVLPDAIGPAFAPRPRESVVSSRFEGEVLIVDGDTGAIHVLNSTAAVIWECFDGEVTLAELAGDIAEAFGAPLETVQRDTIAVAQELGGRNLLAGVSPPVPEGAEIAGSLEVGEEMSPIRVGDAEDVEATIPRPGAKGTLLVNWSPYCGYCGKIVSDLAACAKPLSNRGIDLVLLTIGAPEDNHQMLDEHGLIPATFHRVETPEGSEAALDPFSSMGTPVAYLLDGDGKVASPLAYGAAEVPALARSAAGLIPVQEDVAPAPRTDAAQAQAAAAGESGESPEALVRRRSLPAASGVCGPSKGGAPKKSRQWAATSAYAIGEYDVGIRTDSLETDALLGQLLTEYRLDGPRTAGDNFSVVLAPDASARSKSLNLLLSADLTVVRSRSPRRVLLALASHLSNLLADPDDGLLRTSNLAALVDGEALLLPAIAPYWLEYLQPRLARLGVRLSDEPHALVDPASRELVIPELRIKLDQGALDKLGEDGPLRSELPPMEPGNYQLRAWTLGAEAVERAGPLTRAGAIAGILAAVEGTPETLGTIIAGIGQVLDGVEAVALPSSSQEELLRGIEERFIS